MWNELSTKMSAMRAITKGITFARSCLRNSRPVTQRLCKRSLSGEGSSLQVSLDEATGIGTLAFNRPPVNSLNLEFMTEINITLDKLENDKKCKGLIITSAFPKVFCAGLDITEMYQPDVDRLQEFWRTLQDMWIRLYGSNLITIAAINGHSPAGGCLIALCCDYRIMAPNYTIGLNETQLGIVAPFWFRDTMLNIVGHRKTEMALQLGLLFKSEEALNIGLVDQVVPQDQVVETAQKEMKRWLSIPGFARQLSKNMMRKPAINKLISRKEEDITNFRDFCTKESIQKALGMYLEALKTRKK